MDFEIAVPSKKVTLQIEPGIFKKAIKNNKGPTAILIDENLAQANYSEFGKIIKIPPGEKSKSIDYANILYQKLMDENFGRDLSIVAIGGGTVTDLAGFVASTYARGVKLILVPTSLLAMVDASIGGKTALNLPGCKNYVGTFYQPETILIDPEFLLTQEINHYKDGLVEMIKHGLVYDLNHFAWIEKNIDKLLSKDLNILTKGIEDSIQIKLKIVQQDVQDNGLRALLNFGHTIGHAIEAASGFKISHGKAVAFGCLVEAHLSGLEIKQLFDLFSKIGFCFDDCLQLTNEQIIKLLTLDKKSINGRPRFVTLKAIGKAHNHNRSFCTYINNDVVINSLDKIKKSLIKFL